MRIPGFAVFVTLLFGSASVSLGQIFGPEGLNMPGTYNGFSNPPTNLAFAGIQVSGGRVLVNTDLPLRRYRTMIYCDVSGADVVGGTYTWLFTSGPSGNYYANKWSDVTVSMNSLQTYTFHTFGGTDNSVTLEDGNYYTVNWKDNGYASTQGIWMQTSAAPVTFTSVTQLPDPGSVTEADPVTVTVGVSPNPSPEEIIYVRYTINNFVSSVLSPVTIASGSGSIDIPAQSGGTTVKYYAFSTTGSPASDYDMYTINHDNNGGANYSYTVTAPSYSIDASSGANGTIFPSGNVIVSSGANQGFLITPALGYYVDSLVVDDSQTDSTTSYTFVNVLANHTVRAVFTLKDSITFRVKMNKKMQDGDFRPDLGDHVTVRGSFNDWGNSTNNPDTLDDGDADSIYVMTKLLKANSSYEYKFWKTLRGGQDYENSIGNRQLSVAEADSVLPVAYFNNEVPASDFVDVEFQVNMSIKMLEGTFRPLLADVVTVRGTFNDWGNSTNNPDTLEDGNNDSIYVKTISLPSSSTIAYKFWKTLRGGLDWEDHIADRSADIQTSDTTLPAVYFDNDATEGVNVSVVEGWNMISNPVNAANDSVTELYPGSVFPYAFAFGVSGYTQQYHMVNGAGFWEKFSADQSNEVPGSFLTLDTIPVQTGWNMIGSISLPVDTGSIVSIPSGIRSSAYFAYSGGYSATTSIDPGKAYWAKMNSAGELVFESSSPASMSRSIMSQPAGIPLDRLGRMTIIDRLGGAQTLYFGSEGEMDVPVEMFELPPAGPAGVFDARFASGRQVELVSRNAVGPMEFPLNIISDAYPITVTWEVPENGNSGFVLRDGITGNLLTSRELYRTGSVQIDNSAVNRLILATGVAELPAEFALLQNYPNPFNPSTSITYHLATANQVTLKVYDVLGQEIATLVNELQSAGVRTATWDGRSSSGRQVASGVYFYRMEIRSTGDGPSFSTTKSMMLLK